MPTRTSTLTGHLKNKWIKKIKKKSKKSKKKKIKKKKNKKQKNKEHELLNYQLARSEKTIKTSKKNY